MYPSDRIPSRKGQATDQHLVKRHTEGIEVTPQINRTIHWCGLFGRHVGERSGDKLGRFGRLTFVQKPRSDPEAHEAYLTSREINQNIGSLHILANQFPFVQAAECRLPD